MILSGAVAAEQRERGGWWPNWGMPHMFGGGGPGGWMGGWMGGWDSDGRIDRIDGRLAYMKAELKITEQQTAAWDGFAAAARSNAESHNAMMESIFEEADDEADKALPERLALRITLMEARLEQMKALKGSIDTLYGVLSEEQRKTADDIVLPMMHLGPRFGPER
jgi:hypothetical protein